MPQKSSAEAPALSTAQQQQPRKLTALERNNLEWKAHKEEIWSIYMDQDKTLKETMQWFEQERSFSWSERKWKEKMKEWDFEKNIPANDTNFMAAKARKRELEDGKETVFYRHCKLVDHGKVGSFKKQKLYENSFQELFIPGEFVTEINIWYNG
ncbi:hypothetical protein N431DRAFT_331094 [Stipitochalara longipes BDJ]|nr:hypothetical protein N431DRAFT_331094 [Stipitochalara longipes BDJ]